MSPYNKDRVFARLLQGGALLAGSVLFLMVAFVAWESLPALAEVGAQRFLSDPSWHPAPEAAAGSFNLAPMIIGTLATSALALLIATPLGLAAALFNQFFAPRSLASIYRRLIELLAGIPSVVYGFWGLVVLVPIIQTLAPPGPSLLAGGLILALMILPTIALLTDAAIDEVPDAYHLAAAGLGFSRTGKIVHVILPAARSGIITGIVLATGRAIGETMAVLMVCGNIVKVPDSLFAPVRTLTANIALEMAYAMDIHRAALFVTGLVLTLMVGALILLAHRLPAPAHA